MSTRSLSVQEETGALQSVQGTAPDPGPALSGPAPALWAGFAAFVVIFVLVLLLIIRGRVLRPAARRAAAKTDFFEPAGDGADITFEDQEPIGDRAKQEPESAPQAEEPLAAPTPAAGGEEEKPTPEAAKSGRAPFAGLFAKKPKPPPPPAAEAPLDEAHTEPEERFAAEAPAYEAPSPEKADSDEPAAAPKRLKVMDDDIEARRRAAEENELRRLEAAEEAEEEARRRRRLEQHAASTAAAALAAAPQRQDLDKLKDDLENAFAARMETLARDVGQRFDAFVERNAAQVPPAHPAEDIAGVSEAHFAEFADLLGEQIHALRESSASSIAALSSRIDKLDANAEDLAVLANRIDSLNDRLGGQPAATLSGRIQLAEVLASVLPATRFTLNGQLSSGKTVDALVNTTADAAPIAVDARFPVEAYDAYQRRRNTPEEAGAETAFRRAVLRHLVDIAQKQIVDGETADAALMFAPSEHILTTLHAVFADLVQESYRARVWIVSPTTLAATLHMISALTAVAAKTTEHEPGAPVTTATQAATAHDHMAAEADDASDAGPAANGDAHERGGSEADADKADAENAEVFAPAAENEPSENPERPTFPLR